MRRWSTPALARRSDEGAASPRLTPPVASPQVATTPTTIRLGEVEVTYRLRVSARARRLRLVIRPETGLEVVLPKGVSRAHAEQLIREKADWILRTSERLAQVAVPESRPLTDGQMLPCAGAELRLALALQPGEPRITIIVRDTTLTLRTPTTDQEVLRAALEGWYRRQATRIFAERLRRANAATPGYGFTYGRVAVRDQKSRWGSCSRAGNLNFNWRLLLAPLPVLDYIVIHELCHLKEPNHSPRFWALVALGCPDYRERRRWLRQHGQELRV